MGRILSIGVIALAILFGAGVFLESEGHPETPLQAPFQEGDVVKLQGEKATALLFAPQGYNEGQIESAIAVLQPKENGTIRQGGDITTPCSYVKYRWWCRVWIRQGDYGWTEAWRLQRING